MGGNPQDVGSLDAAVASTQGMPNTPIGQICAPCVAENWIYLRYEHADGQGVSGASYVVQKVTDDGTPTGEVLAEGVTDAEGNAFAKLDEEDTQVEFYFYHDPDGDPYEDPEATAPIEEPEDGFWEGMWKGITGAADWVWGVLEGDFNEDASTGQIIGRMILTMIPGIDQLADVQDVINILYKLIWKKEYDEKWNWILLVITLIGMIPVLGSLAKGLLKLVFKRFGDISALRGLYGVFNFFSIGNAHRWLRDFATNLTGAHLDAAIDVLNTMMTRVVYYMTEAKTWLGGITGWNGLIDEGLVKVASFQSMAPRKLREAAADLQRKLLDTIAVAMTRIQRVGTKNGPGDPYIVKQDVVEPPDRLPDGPARRWTSRQVAGRRVYQRDDLIDPDRIDPSTGMTNRELMEDGKAPFGADGERINLHHMTQDEPGPMAEVGGQFHRENDRALHMYTNQYDKSWVGPDGIRRQYNSAPDSMDRGPFNRWKTDYWIERARDF